MKVVSPLLKRVVYPALSSTGYLRHRARHGQLCIVTYHGVRPDGYVSRVPHLDGSLVSPQNFRSQLRLLKRDCQIIPPELFLSWLRGQTTLPPRSVLLTCDDGLESVLTDMVPILQEESARCLFLVTGASAKEEPSMLWYDELYLLLRAVPPGPISIAEKDLSAACTKKTDRRAFWWSLVQLLSERDEQARADILGRLQARFGSSGTWKSGILADAASRRRFFLLTRSGLRSLVESGMSIGAHTLHHPVLSRMPATGAEEEITGSRVLLQDVLGQEIWAFAYPFGDLASVTAREIKLAQSAQFACAFLNVGGGFGAELPPFALPRVHVTASMGLSEFEAHVSGFYRQLRDGPRPAAAVGGRT